MPEETKDSKSAAPAVKPTGPVAKKPEPEETKDSKPAEAKEPTVTYYGPAQSRKLVRKETYPDATADLHDPDTGELLVGRCPLSAEPRVGHYTP